MGVASTTPVGPTSSLPDCFDQARPTDSHLRLRFAFVNLFASTVPAAPEPRLPGGRLLRGRGRDAARRTGCPQGRAPGRDGRPASFGGATARHGARATPTPSGCICALLPVDPSPRRSIRAQAGVTGSNGPASTRRTPASRALPGSAASASRATPSRDEFRRCPAAPPQAPARPRRPPASRGQPRTRRCMDVGAGLAERRRESRSPLSGQRAPDRQHAATGPEEPGSDDARGDGEPRTGPAGRVRLAEPPTSRRASPGHPQDGARRTDGPYPAGASEDRPTPPPGLPRSSGNSATGTPPSPPPRTSMLMCICGLQSPGRSPEPLLRPSSRMPLGSPPANPGRGRRLACFSGRAGERGTCPPPSAGRSASSRLAARRARARRRVPPIDAPKPRPYLAWSVLERFPV